MKGCTLQKSFVMPGNTAQVKYANFRHLSSDRSASVRPLRSSKCQRNIATTGSTFTKKMLFKFYVNKLPTEVESVVGRELIADRSRVGPQRSATQRPIKIVAFVLVAPFAEIRIELAFI